MPRGRSIYSTAVVLPVVIVIAVSVLVAIAIGAWLVREVARDAIKSTTPEGVAPVVAALGGLLDALRLFLPWSRSLGHGVSSGDHSGMAERPRHDHAEDCQGRPS